ncbi:hypothetical protein SASPL_122117 [Salvia splendens]|uniref:Small subunit ribosomal protein S13 n=1 Tax=Salvia splendens TaxID=180675 RepID=A0A8X8XJF5_SALSN|nr:hypothetical protein SASPL_122117 [Salvia splendens]
MCLFLLFQLQFEVLDVIIRYPGLDRWGMQRLIRAEQSLAGWKNKSLTHGIGVTAPKARTRDKLKPVNL